MNRLPLYIGITALCASAGALAEVKALSNKAMSEQAVASPTIAPDATGANDVETLLEQQRRLSQPNDAQPLVLQPQPEAVGPPPAATDFLNAIIDMTNGLSPPPPTP